MEDLLRHHIHDTERRFDDVMEELQYIHQKIENFQEFKTSAVVSARWVSFAVSAGCGIATFVASTFVNFLIEKTKH